MSEQIEVTQADRQLLAELFDMSGKSRSAVLDPEFSHKPFVLEKLQLIARHRNAGARAHTTPRAVAEAVAKERERCARVAESYVSEWAPVIADEIREGNRDD